MKFTPSHEWIKVEDLTGTVGITAYAKKELGDIVFVELPKVGSFVKMGEEVCVLESTKAAADVYAPVSGKIVAVNDKLKESLSELNTSPETAGWLFKIELSDLKDLDALLDAKGYKSVVENTD